MSTDGVHVTRMKVITCNCFVFGVTRQGCVIECVCLCVFLAARMHQLAHRSGRCADGSCLLGIILLGTWTHSRRTDTGYQHQQRTGQLVQHILQRDAFRKARPASRFHWLRAQCHRYVLLTNERGGPGSVSINSHRWIPLLFPLSNSNVKSTKRHMTV